MADTYWTVSPLYSTQGTVKERMVYGRNVRSALKSANYRFSTLFADRADAEQFAAKVKATTGVEMRIAESVRQ